MRKRIKINGVLYEAVSGQNDDLLSTFSDFARKNRRYEWTVDHSKFGVSVSTDNFNIPMESGEVSPASVEISVEYKTADDHYNLTIFPDSDDDELDPDFWYDVRSKLPVYWKISNSANLSGKPTIKGLQEIQKAIVSALK